MGLCMSTSDDVVSNVVLRDDGSGAIVHIVVSPSSKSTDLVTARKNKILGEAKDDELMEEIHEREIDVQSHITEDTVKSYYTFGKELGKGASAKVYLATEKKSQAQWAIKVVKKDGKMNDEESMNNEVEILKRVRHKNVLYMHELFESIKCCYIVLELVDGGDIKGYLASIHHYSEMVAATQIKQILEGVHYLHSLGIVHRDLKPANIMLQGQGENRTVKIVDFGLSALIKLGKKYDPEKSSKRKGYNELKEQWGSPAYMAPEIYDTTGYGPQVDIWAVGCILYNLLSNHLIACGRDVTASRLQSQIDSVDRSFTKKISPEAKILMKKLLEIDPRRRDSASEALHDPWITGDCHNDCHNEHLTDTHKGLKETPLTEDDTKAPSLNFINRHRSITGEILTPAVVHSEVSQGLVTKESRAKAMHDRLGEVNDDQLLAEVARRHIDVRKQITEDSVQRSYTFGDLLYEKKTSTEEIKVFAGTQLKNDKKIVIKIRTSLTPGTEMEVETEVEILKRLNHANVARLLELFSTIDTHWMVFEYIHQSNSLQTWTLPTSSEKVDEIPSILKQILLGVHYLHGRGVVHRNLSPGNIMIENGHVRIIHFDQAALIPLGQGYAKDTSSKRKTYNSLTEVIYVDSQDACYKAPEMTSASPAYGPQVDIFAIGVILYFLFTGEHKNGQQILAALNPKKSATPRSPDTDSATTASLVPTSSSYRQLQLSLLETNLAKRTSATEALKHSYIKNAK